MWRYGTAAELDGCTIETGFYFMGYQLSHGVHCEVDSVRSRARCLPGSRVRHLRIQNELNAGGRYDIMLVRDLSHLAPD